MFLRTNRLSMKYDIKQRPLKLNPIIGRRYSRLQLIRCENVSQKKYEISDENFISQKIIRFVLSKHILIRYFKIVCYKNEFPPKMILLFIKVFKNL